MVKIKKGPEYEWVDYLHYAAMDDGECRDHTVIINGMRTQRIGFVAGGCLYCPYPGYYMKHYPGEFEV